VIWLNKVKKNFENAGKVQDRDSSFGFILRTSIPDPIFHGSRPGQNDTVSVSLDEPDLDTLNSIIADIEEN
jgi:hypothetical protein